MGYSSNKRFSPLTDSIRLVIDGCGNTYEDKYYVNGTYIDFCGLSVEDYMKNPCCGGGGSGSGSENTKPKNNIKVISYEAEGYVYYQAIATYPVTSNIKIRVSNSETDTVTELDIYAGETESDPERGESLKIKDVTVDVKEDDDFMYTPTIGDNEGDDPETEDIMHYIYVATLHLDELKALDVETIKTLQSFTMNEGTTVDIKYIIPPTDVDCGDMEIEEFEKFCIDNQYAFALIFPKKIYDNNAYIISNYGGVDIKKNFVLDSTYVIDSEDYVCLVEKATDDMMPFVPLYQEELIYEYKLTLNK